MTIGMAWASNAAGRPLSASAATAASAVALCASAGPATTSPTAAMRSVARMSSPTAIRPSAPTRDAGLGQAQLVGVGDAADGDDHALGLDAVLAVRARDHERAVLEALRGRLRSRRSTPSARRRRATGAVSDCVDGRQDAVERLDHGHARAELGQRRARARGRCSRRRRRRRWRAPRSAPARRSSPGRARRRRAGPGSATGREPVATIACSNSKKTTRSSGVRTATRSARLKRASPCTTRTSPASSSRPTPRARPAHSSPRQAWKRSSETAHAVGARARRRAGRACAAPRRPARSAPCWGCSRPAGRRRPARPGRARSTSVTLRPSWAARMAAA